MKSAAEPQDVVEQEKEPAERATVRRSASKSKIIRYRALRALDVPTFVILGFRYAPPQALCLRPLRGLKQLTPAELDQSFLKFIDSDNDTDPLPER